MRLDKYLTEAGYAESRTQAQNLICEGNVLLDGKRIVKPSYAVDENGNLTVRIVNRQKYVSRGGLKLEKALSVFSLDVRGMCALDVGASTGGFTDCLLQNGASRVYAVDAGEGQLAPSLRTDARVVCIEKYNARDLKKEDFPEVFDIAVMDVSFISQTLILPGLSALLPEGGLLVSLVKPQFEAGRECVGKNGIVKYARDRRKALERVIDCAETLELTCFGADVSPICGGDGNVEFIVAFRKGGTPKLDRSKIGELSAKEPNGGKKCESCSDYQL